MTTYPQTTPNLGIPLLQGNLTNDWRQINDALLVVDDAALGSGAGDARYLPLTGGTLSGPLRLVHGTSDAVTVRLPTDANPRLMLGITGAITWGDGTALTDNSLSRFGPNDLRTTASLTPTTTNARDLGTAALRWRTLFAQNLDVAGTTALLDPLVRDSLQFATKPSGTADTTLQRTAAGRLRLVGPQPAYEARMTGQNSGAYFGQATGTGIPRLDAAANAWFDGTNWRLDDPAHPGALLGMMPGAATTTPLFGLWDLPADSADPVGRLTVSRAGTLSITPDGTNAAINAFNLCRVGPGPSGLAGWWYASADGVDRAFVGLDAGSTTSFRLFSGPRGNILTVDLTTGATVLNGTLTVGGGEISGAPAANLTIVAPAGGSIIVNPGSAYFYPVNSTVRLGHPSVPFADIYTVGSLIGSGPVLNIQSGANIQLAPAAGFVHPDANGTRNLGHQSIAWANVFSNALVSPGQLSLSAGTHTVISSAADPWCVYLRGGGHIWVDAHGTPNAILGPERDGAVLCGGVSNRWGYVSAVNGSINTCRAEEKAILGPVEPGWALEAVLGTPIKLYHPRGPGGGAVDESLTFAGIVDDCADPRMQIGAGSFTSATHQAALAMAAVQALTGQISDLRAEVARVKEALAA